MPWTLHHVIAQISLSSNYHYIELVGQKMFQRKSLFCLFSYAPSVKYQRDFVCFQNRIINNIAFIQLSFGLIINLVAYFSVLEWCRQKRIVRRDHSAEENIECSSAALESVISSNNFREEQGSSVMGLDQATNSHNRAVLAAVSSLSNASEQSS